MWSYPGHCLNCGSPAEFVEPNLRTYTCKCGDPGVKLSPAPCRSVANDELFSRSLRQIDSFELVEFLKKKFMAAWGKREEQITSEVAEKIAKSEAIDEEEDSLLTGTWATMPKIRAAGSKAYPRPGSRPESPPTGGRAPKGPSGGNDASSLCTVDAFSALIGGIESLKKRGKLSEERLRTIVSDLIGLIYKENGNGK